MQISQELSKIFDFFKKNFLSYHNVLLKLAEINFKAGRVVCGRKLHADLKLKASLLATVFFAQCNDTDSTIFSNDNPDTIFICLFCC